MTFYRAKAPLRLGIAGGGTDISPYSDLYGGAILNATINMFAFASIEPRNDEKIEIISNDFGVREEVKSVEKLEYNGNLDLIKCVYNRIVKDFAKQKLSFSLITDANVPVGSGLGTSSAVVVAVIGAFCEWLKIPLGEYEIAKLAFEIERKDLKLAGGKQDQYAASFGGVNFMEFDNGDVIVNPLRIKNHYLMELENNLLLFFTGKSRHSDEIIKKKIESIKNNKQSVDSMHKMKELAFEAKKHLLKGHIDKLGELLDEMWSYKKKTAKCVSSPIIDEIYENAKKGGALGGKVSGAGGGGFMYFYCPGNTKYKVIEKISKFKGDIRRFEFTKKGVISWQI